MSVETATTISELTSNWPLPGDLTNQGDAHIRLIKSVLQSQFPGADGLGFATPITATEAEINFLDGVAANIQAALDALTASATAIGGALNAPAGTRMIFFQAAAPVGWTQDVTYNDYTLRIVAGVGGGTGGTDSPFTTDLSHTHTTSGHALTEAEMPSHTHMLSTCADTNSVVGNTPDKLLSVGNGSGPLSSSSSVASSGAGQPHEHGDTGAGNLTFAPLYINSIIGVKD
jgi:hypothetical protein